ncbi:thiamine pyrophosphokinase [Aspergillus flavus]|uniref:Thiamine pyrophosphokinase n=1 Tax=Aspergillus flavus TaxID=5059 RepID=A0A5N6HB24_ASPFL|nr:thiamine pyrophosphokinase [Aspergillus flavus]
MEWDPTQFFRDDHTPNPFALLILNQPINERAFRVLKRHAKVTLCADGGANRFYSMMKAHDRESIDLPDLIIGDLDSITPDTRTHYANLGVRIIHDEDQYSTDFTKCLNYLRAHVGEFLSSSTSSSQSSSEHSVSTSEEVKKGEEEEEERELDVLILGGLGGRVDQAFSQIHHLYSMTQSYGSSSSSTTSSRGDLTSNPGKVGKIGNLYLISEESITFILRPGLNTIRTPGTNRPGLSTGEYLLEENVGIIPLLGPARITTSGFQWDVVAWRTEIGGQLSTSNHIRSEVVTVESVMPVLFTLELAGRLKRDR